MKHFLVSEIGHNAVIIATSLRDARDYNKTTPGLGGKLTEVNPQGIGDYHVMYTTPKAQQAIREKNKAIGIF